MMIQPVSMAHVAFRGNDGATAMNAIDKAQKAMEAMTNLTEGADEFKKNMKTDSEAYSDAVTDTLTKAAEENKALKPLAEAANSKAPVRLISANMSALRARQCRVFLLSWTNFRFFTMNRRTEK